MKEHVYRYPWPSSRLDPEDMHLLHRVRTALAEQGIRKPITVLVKQAIQETFAEFQERVEADKP